MKKPGKPSFFKASLLAVLITTALGAQAAGLGKLTVYSAIGQPLNAEVALTATAEELTSLSAKLASPDAFREAGIEFMPALAGLNLSVVNLNKGLPLLKLTTERPINEPFLHFLVELNWTAGRMVREYTFLLDPPEVLQVAKAASVVSPVAPAASALSASEPVPAKSSPQAVQPRVIDPGAAKLPVAPATTGEGYRVVAGDTLSKIARENQAESVSLDQMLVALFNSNRDAFIGNNMNRLRAGKILRVPDAAEAAKLNVGEARKLILGQAAEFNAYRRRLADVVSAAPIVEAAPQQQAAGIIKPPVEEKAPPVEAKDKLEVSRTETAKSAKALGGSRLEEDLIARDKALREASERIADLEKNIENLKQLVEIKSQMGAKLQQESQAAPVQAATAEVRPAAPIPEPAAPPMPTAEEASKPVAPPPPAKPPVKKPPPPPPEADFIEENLQLVFGGGALVALLLGYLGFTAWRKKKMLGAEQPTEPAIALPNAAGASTSAAVFGAASERVDNGEVSIQGDFSDGGMLTTEEKVDPVAEADVLMAYGRDRQAEDILLEGLRQDGERAAIHMKLLELYAKQENIAQFEVVANQLHNLNSGRGADWDRALAMAHRLGLADGIFMGAESRAPAEIIQPVELPVTIQPTPPSVKSAAVESVSVMVDSSQALEAPKAEDGGSLDFDLDLGSTSGPPAAEVAAPVAAAPASEEAMSLDFDFDLGTPEPSQQDAQEAAAQPAAGTDAVADAGSVDFSFDLDLGADAQETAAVESEAAAPSVDAVDLDFDLDLGSEESPEADVVQLDLPDEQASEVAAANPISGEGSSDLKLDFDLELDAEPAQEVTEDLPEPAADLDADMPVALDLSDISLDLDEIESVASGAEPSVSLPVVTEAVADDASLADLPPLAVAHEKPVAAMVDLPDIDLSSDTGEAATSSLAEITAGGLSGGEAAPAVVVVAEPDNPEVTTKLELAQAYEEMGDQEGARDLLNEVLTEGSASQQALARLRLDQLGA